MNIFVNKESNICLENLFECQTQVQRQNGHGTLSLPRIELYKWVPAIQFQFKSISFFSTFQLTGITFTVNVTKKQLCLINNN